MKTHLVFKRQGLANISRESIDDDAASIRYLHDLLLNLSNCGLLGESDINMLDLFTLPKSLMSCSDEEKQNKDAALLKKPAVSFYCQIEFVHNLFLKSTSCTHTSPS